MRQSIGRLVSIFFVVFLLASGMLGEGKFCFGQVPVFRVAGYRVAGFPVPVSQMDAAQSVVFKAAVSQTASSKLLLGFVVTQDISDGVTTAGDSEPDDVTTESSDADSTGVGISDDGLGDETDSAPTEKRTMLEMMFTGNLFGVGIVIAILLLSVISTILIVENAISIRRKRLLPPEVVQSLESALALRDTRGAMMICSDVDNHSLVTQVVQAGLERYRSSEFGFAEYRSAVEEAGDHVTGQLYRKVEVLNVIASIAPMLGLTGTVIGMIDAFNTIAANQGVAGPEDLAGGIGQALITTLLGLLVAIPTMVAFSFFRSRIDSLVSEAGTRIERMMLPLGRRKSK